MPTATSTRLPFERSTWLLVTGVVTAAAMALLIAGPLSAPVLLIGCLLMAQFWVIYDGGAPRPFSLSVASTLAVVVGWFAVTILWTSDTASASFALTLFVIAAIVVTRAPALLDALSVDVQRVIAIGFVSGIGFGAWLLFEENASGFFLRRTFNSIIPMTRPHSVIERLPSGWIAAMPAYVTNKNTATAMVMLWPLMLISKPLARSPWLRLLLGATFAIAAAGIFLSEHETSKLAILASTIVFALTRWSRRAAFAVVAAAWVAASLLVIPISTIAYRSGVHTVEKIQFSGRHRLVIWGKTAESIWARPLLGHGLASTRVLDEMTPPEERRTAPGTNLPEGINMHSHNVFVQAWHETGAIGGLLVFLAGLPVLSWLRARSDETAPYLFAAFTASLVLASLSWSLVASWYIALFGIIAVWMRFADVWARQPPPAREAPTIVA